MIGHFTTFAAAAKQLTDPFTTCQQMTYQMGGGSFSAEKLIKSPIINLLISKQAGG